MSDKPFISIIIPTLNEEKYIKSCLYSLFSQTYPVELIEIFIIDGESSDRTVQIVNEIRKDRENLFVLKNKLRIQSAAFNIGVEKAKGDILIRLDAHCTYEANYILNCVMNHIESKYGNVGGRCIVRPGSDTLTGRTIASINTSFFGLGGATFRMGKNKKLVKTVPFGAFRKEVVMMIGGMNELLQRGEDNEYNARIIKAGYNILFDPRIIAYYYSRSTLKLFLKQMYQNGFSIGALAHSSITSLTVRHYIPFLFVLFLVLSSIFSLHFQQIRYILYSTILIYFILNIIFGLRATYKTEIKILPIWVFTVFLAHISYGIGTFNGIIMRGYSRV